MACAKEDKTQDQYPSVSSAYSWKGTLNQSGNTWTVLAHCTQRQEDVIIYVTKLNDLENDSQIDAIKQHIKSMTVVDQCNLMTPVHHFMTQTELWVIYKRLSGGPVSELISTNFQTGIENEKLVSRILLDIATGLAHLHKQKICHRNIRGSSIHLCRDDGRSLLNQLQYLKEYGFYNLAQDSSDSARHSVFRKEDRRLAWTDPKIIFHDPRIKEDAPSPFLGDIYSFGITALELAYGEPPAPPTTDNMKPVGLHSYDRANPFGETFSKLVSACLRFENKDRITAGKLPAHPFFKKAAPRSEVADQLAHMLKSTEMRVNDNFLPPSSFPNVPQPTPLVHQESLQFNFDTTIHDDITPPENDTPSKSNSNHTTQSQTPESSATGSRPSQPVSENHTTPMASAANHTSQPHNKSASNSIEVRIDNANTSPLPTIQDHSHSHSDSDNHSDLPLQLRNIRSDSLQDQHHDVQTPSYADTQSIGRFKVSRPSHSESHPHSGHESPSGTPQEEYSVSESGRSDDDHEEQDEPPTKTVGRFFVEKLTKQELKNDTNKQPTANGKSANTHEDKIRQSRENINIHRNNSAHSSQNGSPPPEPPTLPPQVSEWTNQHCVDWIASLGGVYAPYADNFKKHVVDGSMLQELDHEMLSELEVNMKLHRVKILKARDKLLES